MPTGAEILELILASDPQADDALDDGHPTAFREVIKAAVERALNNVTATSGSSVTIGTGSKVFQLDEARGWLAGMPVYIVDNAAPTTNWMAGKLSADESATAELTVEVETVNGSGTLTDWSIFVLLSFSTVVSSPVAVADGGTGANTAAGARTALEVALTKHVREARSDPPPAPSTGDDYLVLPTATGDWAGQDNDFAEWDGAAWQFTSPPDGALAFEAESSGAQRAGAIWRWSAFWGNWVLVGSQAMGSLPDATLGTTTTIGTADIGQPGDRWRHYVTTAGGITVTIPDADAESGAVLVITNKAVSSVTVNVTGGGTINGATSISLAQWETARLNSVDTGGGREWIRW